MSGSAIEAALARGRKARGKKPKWEPVGVDHPGWLTARIRNVGTGEVEGVFYAQGCWQFRRVGWSAEGKPKSFEVRDQELKRIAKAMVGPRAVGRDELIVECSKLRREKSQNQVSKAPKSTRRKAQSGR